MSAMGTTTVEAKSGYGLSFEAEITSLEAIRDAAKQWQGTVVPTLLGAHVVPAEFRERREEYVTLVRDKMIPEAARRKLAEYVDVFCEHGAFTMKETQAIFASAKEHGLGTRAHVCQLSEAALGSTRAIPARLLRSHELHRGRNVRVACEDEHRQQHCCPERITFSALGKYPPARKLIDFRRGRCVGDGLQPGNIADGEYAVCSVASVHADEDVSGGGDYGSNLQWRVCARLAGSQGEHRAGQRC